MSKIVVEFESLFDRLRGLSEVKSRAHESDVIIIKESDKVVFKLFFSDGATEIMDSTGRVERSDVYEDNMIIRLSDAEKKNKFKKLEGYFLKALTEYCFYRWFDLLDLKEFSRDSYNKFEAYVRDINHNSTEPSFVKPKYRVYY